MSKRLTYFGSVVIALTMILTACQPTPAAKVVINYWHAGSGVAEGALFNTLIEEYTKVHPEVEIKVSYNTTLDKVLAAATAGNPPELFMNWGPQFVGSWANAGALEPLDNYLSAGNVDLNDILPGLLKSTTMDGKIYGVPYGTDMSMLIYNADLYKVAGLDPDKPPVTTEELLTYAEKLTIVEGNEIKQIGWLPNYGWTHVGGDGSISIRYGPTFFHEDGTAGFDDPRWVEVFNFAKWPFATYGYENVQLFKTSFGEYGTAQDPMCTGKLAMIYDGEWVAGNYQKNCPDVDLRFVRFPYPAAHPELKDDFEMGGTTIVMPATAPQKIEAGKFLAFLMQPENLARFAYTTGVGNIPHSYKALALYDQYKSQQPDDYKYFIDLAQTVNAAVIPASPISDEFFTEIGNTEELIYADKVTIEQGLADLQAKLMGIYQDKVK
jgi:multiple sugar transport system substrate-binding protein